MAKWALYEEKAYCMAILKREITKTELYWFESKFIQ